MLVLNATYKEQQSAAAILEHQLSWRLNTQCFQDNNQVAVLCIGDFTLAASEELSQIKGVSQKILRPELYTPVHAAIHMHTTNQSNLLSHEATLPRECNDCTRGYGTYNKHVCQYLC